MAPLVLGQLENIKGPLEDLDPALRTNFLKWSYGVSGLDLVSATETNSRYVVLDLKCCLVSRSFL